MQPILPWHDFFAAAAGASAALTGFVFVAVSINLGRILEFPQLPARVFEGLVTLLSVLVVALFALIPGQPPWIHGIEFAGTGLVVWVANTAAIVRLRHVTPRHARPALRILANQLPPLPFVVAGILLILGNPFGMYWIVPGVMLAFWGGLVNAWVLLIEIKR